MSKTVMGPIDYEDLAKGMEMAKLERKGIHTGHFTPSRYSAPAAPKEVREARKKAGLDRTEFASALGVSKKTIEAWEIGARNPDGLATKVLRRILVRPAIIKELAKTH